VNPSGRDRENPLWRDMPMRRSMVRAAATRLLDGVT